MTARKTLFVILGILMILAGITCFFTPVETSSVIPFIFGLAMVIDGIGRIIAGALLHGSVSVNMRRRVAGSSRVQ